MNILALNFDCQVRVALQRPPSHQLRVRPGQRLQLRCNTDALRHLRDEAPAAAVVWLANGDRVLPEDGRV